MGVLNDPRAYRLATAAALQRQRTRHVVDAADAAAAGGGEGGEGGGEGDTEALDALLAAIEANAAQNRGPRSDGQ